MTERTRLSVLKPSYIISMKIKAQKGFTMIELVIYIAGLLALGTVLTLMIVRFYGLYKEIIAAPRADRAALLVMDRLTKDLRAANEIDAVQSVFGSTSGVIEFDTVDGGDTISKRYYLEDGMVKYREDDGAATNITPKDLQVTNFNFAFVTTDNSEAVRITMEFQYKTRAATETKSYAGFAILRESYE